MKQEGIYILGDEVLWKRFKNSFIMVSLLLILLVLASSKIG